VQLTDTAVLITGAKRIGAVVGRELAARGADVAFGYARSKAEADQAAADVRALGRRAAIFQADLSQAEWLIRKMENNLHMQTATWLVTRELTEAAGPWNTKLLGDDDGEYFCRVLMQSDGVRFAPESKVFYRMAGPSSLSYIASSDKKKDAQLHSMRLHIGYLRSLEDTPRSRAACVQYLQNWLVNFHPERPDLVQQMQQLAVELGGHLEVPELSWKYRWIQALVGGIGAKRAQVRLRQLKWSVVRFWDKTLFRMENLTA